MEGLMELHILIYNNQILNENNRIADSIKSYNPVFVKFKVNS